MRQRYVTATAFMLTLGMLLPGCAVENLPPGTRSTASAILGVSLDAPAPYPFELPAPGLSSKADLAPRAESARQRGLMAADSGDWPSAVAAFQEANNAAHSSPALMFNLARAYQRGGWSVPAAMWSGLFSSASRRT